MGNKPLPTGDDALALELGHLYVSAPMRLETPRRTEHGMPPLRVLIGGVSIDNKGWLYAWVAYVPSADDLPTLMVWPRAQGSVPFCRWSRPPPRSRSSAGSTPRHAPSHACRTT